MVFALLIQLRWFFLPLMVIRGGPSYLEDIGEKGKIAFFVRLNFEQRIRIRVPWEKQ
jgi:hypothetical protein